MKRLDHSEDSLYFPRANECSYYTDIGTDDGNDIVWLAQDVALSLRKYNIA